MEIRYHIDRDTNQPHIFGHGVSEREVEQVLLSPLEARRGSDGSHVLIGRTHAGRILKVIIVLDEEGDGVFVVTAYDLAGKALKALRRRLRKRGQQ